jgi:hypothetical protein
LSREKHHEARAALAFTADQPLDRVEIDVGPLRAIPQVDR